MSSRKKVRSLIRKKMRGSIRKLIRKRKLHR